MYNLRMNSKPFWQQFHSIHLHQSYRKKIKKLPDNKILLLSLLCCTGYLIFAIPSYYVLQLNISTVESLYLNSHSALITGLRHELLVIKIAFVLGLLFTFIFSLLIARRLVLNSSNKLKLDFINSVSLNDSDEEIVSNAYRCRVS